MVLDLVLSDDTTAPREQLLKTLKSQARSLSDVVESILPQRSQTRTASSTTLPELVKTTAQELEPIAHKKGLALRVSVAKSVQHLELDVDGFAVARILRNYLVNAIKFTQSGSIQVALEQSCKLVAMSVTDTGCGISPDKMHLMFRPFKPGTDEASCTGLGLWLCSELAHSIGATVYVDSKVGVGSCFGLLIPAARPANLVSPPKAAKP
jgi:signal transduction histidine kinase